jgi:Holliday junction resolvase
VSNAGTSREYVVRDHLAGLGYFVMRAPGSKVRLPDPDERAPVDLLALPPGGGQVLMVQVKRGAGRLRPAPWNQLLSLAGLYGAVPILAEAVPRRPIVYWRLTGWKVEGRTGGSPKQPYAAFDPAPQAGGHCPRPGHLGTWEHGSPPLDRLADGSGWACPGITDGGACGYFRAAAAQTVLTP